MSRPNQGKPKANEKRMISEEHHKECVRVLNLLINKKMQERWAWVFMKPVEGIPGYEDVIRKPMDLGTVKTNLGSKPSRCRFKTYEKFVKDVRLVFQNALLYNKADADIPGSVYDAAQYLMNIFETAYVAAEENVFSKTPGTVESVDVSDVALDKPSQVPFHAGKSTVSTREANPDEAKSRHPGPHDDGTPIKKKKESKKEVDEQEVSSLLSDEDQAKCQQILEEVMTFREEDILVALPFLEPVNTAAYPDYKVKIKKRLHLNGIQKKLMKQGYKSKDEFARDMRQLFSNCLVYNSDVVLSHEIRRSTITLMKLFEKRLLLQGLGSWPGIEERWKCHEVLETLLRHRTDGEESALWFKYPIQTYFESVDMVPEGYFDIIKKPMDLGTASDKLHTGKYTATGAFCADLELVFQNCLQYWQSDPNGRPYCHSANVLRLELDKAVATHLRGSAAKESSMVVQQKKTPTSIDKKAKESPAFKSRDGKSKSEKSKKRKFSAKKGCLAMLKLAKKHKMKGPWEFEVYTAGPFLLPVDVSLYPDYTTVIKNPMDFSTIEKKLKSDAYQTLDEFKQDCYLIVENCLTYNSDPVQGADIRTMALNLKSFMEEEISKLSIEDEVEADGSSCKEESKTEPILKDEVQKVLLPAEKEGKERKKKKKQVDETGSVDAHASKVSRKRKHSGSGVDEKASVEVNAEASLKRFKLARSVSLSEIGALNLPEPESSIERILRHLYKHASLLKYNFNRSNVYEILSFIPASKIEASGVLHLEGSLDFLFDNLRNRKYQENARLFESDIFQFFDSIVEILRVEAKAIEKRRRAKTGEGENDLTEESEDDWALNFFEISKHFRNYVEEVCLEWLPANFSECPERLERRNQKRKDREATVRTIALKVKSRDCTRILRTLMSQKYDKLCWPFRQPVLELFPNLPADYFDIITKPRDLKTISEKLAGNLMDEAYDTYGEFMNDARLTFENAMKYNKADGHANANALSDEEANGSINYAAKTMLDVFDELWATTTLDVAEASRREQIESVLSEIEKRRRLIKEGELALLDQERRKKMYELQLKEQRFAEAEAEKVADLQMRQEMEFMSARSKLEKMTKEERKAEDKKRKRLRREEEKKVTDHIRRHALVATEEARREAEKRSRRYQRRLQALVEEEMQKRQALKNVKQERQAVVEQQTKLDATKWSGRLSTFWTLRSSKTRVQLAIFNNEGV